ncbi:MAG: transketolase [Candidatus Niyogibacteria bacterium CG10_big_fil_rev_8_21_14_0_10_46_36]|uniref:Transketolase n=1 Tax=Candidatus Niyogibacteria bacterium CG10_big_fil_rev_8_21_14_0_10_46_36 TaxID=1974726 RepID=A0A2H0TD93_9BACT|nr:MAG: transketolase [Candidatus Niyogibacteria bacterium CG10_big_fil_rev_8_21_14_0_10_46_36]
MNLVEQALDVKALEQAPIRNGYGEGLVEAGKKFPNVVALCADLTESTRTEDFRKAFPERFLQIGVAEQNLASVAAGMAAAGKIPYISSYAMFSPGRNWEQIRTTICYNEQHVIVAGAHAGVSVGPDGATHQAVEDMAIMRVIPNMTVLAPCDVHEARKATFAAASLPGPVYIRFAREKTPIFTTPETPFEIGKAEIFWEGKDPQVALIACGPLVHNALLAAGMLAEDGIDAIVVDNHTIKPMDEKTVIDVAKKAGALVTIEEHQINGGMGSAVAEIITRNVPVPIEFVGVLNRFGESGEPTELIEKLGMGPASIAEAAKKVIQRK